MLKQLSAPWKIFCVTTLLLAIGYVGVLVYVHKTFADDALEHWVYYNAVVLSNMTRSGNDFTNNTNHNLRYHNHHNHSVGLYTMRCVAEWKDVTPEPDILEGDPLDVTFELNAGPNLYGTQSVYTSRTKTLDLNHLYQAGAYTNMFNTPEWDNQPQGGFAQAEKFTATFDPDDFPGQPPRPVEAIKTSGHGEP